MCVIKCIARKRSLQYIELIEGLFVLYCNVKI